MKFLLASIRQINRRAGVMNRALSGGVGFSKRRKGNAEFAFKTGWRGL
jgi:hypothetical protein